MFQIKKSIAILFGLVFLSEFTNANSNNRNQIIIDISEQRLYLYEKDILKHSFPVSTSSFGEGSIENSFKTPLGSHQIKEKIGTNVPINTIFIAREISSSDESVEVINKMGLLKAEGFKNHDYDGKIFFVGKVEFIINE